MFHSLNAINDWFLVNKLKLSLDKCLYTIFNMGNRRLLPADHGLSVSGIQLKRTKSVKYLGVFIDEDLTWQDHIHYIINKLMKFCSIFYKLRSILPKPIFKKLFFALVHPHLVYSIEIYANMFQKYLDPLMKLNNKILRILQNQKLHYPVLNLYSDLQNSSNTSTSQLLYSNVNAQI